MVHDLSDLSTDVSYREQLFDALHRERLIKLFRLNTYTCRIKVEDVYDGVSWWEERYDVIYTRNKKHPHIDERLYVFQSMDMGSRITIVDAYLDHYIIGCCKGLDLDARALSLAMVRCESVRIGVAPCDEDGEPGEFLRCPIRPF